jgi:uncharacterized membrane protein
MNEREQAKMIADQWLDFRMNPLVQMVHGDPDCDAVVLARQYMRALEEVERLKKKGGGMSLAPSGWIIIRMLAIIVGIIVGLLTHSVLYGVLAIPVSGVVMFCVLVFVGLLGWMDSGSH